MSSGCREDVRTVGWCHGSAPRPHWYVWPSELDRMAQIAGMTLRERWTGWNHEPFTSDSTSHVWVWQKTPEQCPDED